MDNNTIKHTHVLEVMDKAWIQINKQQAKLKASSFRNDFKEKYPPKKKCSQKKFNEDQEIKV